MMTFANKVVVWFGNTAKYEQTESNTKDVLPGKLRKQVVRCILPLLLLTLTINMTIMFSVPIEWTMSDWFWLKDLISIVGACALYVAIKSLFVYSPKNH